MAKLCGEAGQMHPSAKLPAPQAYQNYAWTILTRNNTITGVLYKDDPTIMAVELANKPHTRCIIVSHMIDAWILVNLRSRLLEAACKAMQTLVHYCDVPWQ